VLDQHPVDSPELLSVRVLLAFNAEGPDEAIAHLEVLAASEYVVPHVPKSKFEQWLAERPRAL
jgi:hypothetical protein